MSWQKNSMGSSLADGDSGLALRVWLAGLATTVLALVCTFGHNVNFAALKMAASSGFIITSLLAGATQTVYGRWLLAGLAFSWWGDFFLLNGSQMSFVTGLISFLIGHVCYTVAFWQYDSRKDIALGGLAVLVLPAALLISALWPNVAPNLRVPVVAYTAVISVMLALSFGTWQKPGFILIIVGALAFYVSDICVARGSFGKQEAINGQIGLPLYFIGQVLLAASAAYVDPDEMRE
ncbi:MAG: lysoplasmalogenase [Candidatus Hydrogenedentes bacterium]|nr:lysoplasmalogenase [Candidatus Hydrogenedentota bacterium]